MKSRYRNALVGGAALTLTALSLPGVGHAASPTMTEARQRCAQAIAMQLGTSVASAHGDSADPLQVFQRPSSEMRLYVYDAHTGAPVATGICQFDPVSGQVMRVRMGRSENAFTLQNFQGLPP